MKMIGALLLMFLFSLSLAANTPTPRLQSAEGVLPAPSIQFLSTFLRSSTLFHFNKKSTPQLPLSSYFKTLPASAKGNFKAWAYEDLAFFCKIEVQLEKAAKMPIKFRIGEVQQVERMEGKY